MKSNQEIYTYVLPRTLAEEETKKYCELLKEGNKEAESKLVEHNLRLVAHIVKKFNSTGLDAEDLFSVGTIGLIKAAKTFDISKNFKLATYASRCIENEILMFLRKNKKNDRLPITENYVLNVDDDGKELLLIETLSSSDDIELEYEKQETSNEIIDSLDNLTKIEKEIIRLRFGLGNNQELTQKEVAGMLGLSQSYISRVEKRGLLKLQKYLVSNGRLGCLLNKQRKIREESDKQLIKMY